MREVTYAIYKKPWGLTYARYYEAPAEDITEHIPACAFPIVLHANGAYSHFDESSEILKGFVSFRQGLDTRSPLKFEERYAVNAPNFLCGWLSPEGTTYACSNTGHAACALDILLWHNMNLSGDAAVSTLLNAGWCMVTYSMQNGVNVIHTRVPNKVQLGRLKELHLLATDTLTFLAKHQLDT